MSIDVGGVTEAEVGAVSVGVAVSLEVSFLSFFPLRNLFLF